ncbi:hypothetical protein QCB45_03675 [Thiomicrorhabdus sp. ZW0627]|uniref:hypothetical protein n=1 Tax=Thiomicrorhabdus sp. ZW0627 TaxID=3039774 RepID=UPI00243695CD|nr:hypothetical protein [Thiomicrorhabdus sp. ZW0627]MDG6773421.1 hypothetical protein [Thiomicrorhabdus sp. ZW0627]
MAETALVESIVEDSIELIKELDNGVYKPSKVIWYYYDDVNSWRLIIVNNEIDKLLPKEEPRAYKVIAEAINKRNLSSLSISEIKLMKSDNPLIETLNFLVKTGPDGFIKATFTDTTINGIFIKDMVILRSA